MPSDKGPRTVPCHWDAYKTFRAPGESRSYSFFFLLPPSSSLPPVILSLSFEGHKWHPPQGPTCSPFFLPWGLGHSGDWAGSNTFPCPTLTPIPY